MSTHSTAQARESGRQDALRGWSKDLDGCTNLGDDDEYLIGYAAGEAERAEKIARAWDPVGWAWYDRAEADHPAKPIFLADNMKRARAVMAVLSITT